MLAGTAIVSDAAGQFRVGEHALCWVHAERLVHTLVLATPVLALNGLPVGYPATSWAAIAALALLSSALAYVIYFRILATAGATNISLVTFLVPVSAILLGWAFLGERLGAAQLLGMALIGGGLALIDGRLLTRRRAMA